MLEALLAPFVLPVRPARPVVAAGAWFLKLGGALAAGYGLAMAALMVHWWWSLRQVVQGLPADSLETGGAFVAIPLVVALATLGLAALATSMFGTALMQWEDRRSKGRTYAQWLGAILLLHAVWNLARWFQLSMDGGTTEWMRGTAFLAAAEVALGFACLGVAAHPAVKRIMAGPAPSP